MCNALFDRLIFGWNKAYIKQAAYRVTHTQVRVAYIFDRARRKAPRAPRRTLAVLRRESLSSHRIGCARKRSHKRKNVRKHQPTAYFSVYFTYEVQALARALEAYLCWIAHLPGARSPKTIVRV